MHNGMGEKLGSVKEKKLIDWDTDSLISERKELGGQAMQRVTSSHKQIDVQPVSRQWLPWKTTLTPPSSSARPITFTQTFEQLLTCINTVGCIQVGQNPAERPVQVKWPRNSVHLALNHSVPLHFCMPVMSKGGSVLSFNVFFSRPQIFDAHQWVPHIM